MGAYTIEDLWDKFGDLKMPVVSLFHPFRLLRLEPVLFAADIREALDCSRFLSDHPSPVGVHGFIQDTLHGFEPFWTR